MYLEKIDLIFQWDDTALDVWYNPVWYGGEIEDEGEEQD